MTDEEKARAKELAAAAPELTEKELQEINNFFRPYVFRRKKTREIWTSCCHYTYTVQKDSEILKAEHQREPKYYNLPRPEPKALCPLCGRMVIVKELGRTGKRENLTEWRHAMALCWDGEALWARLYDCMKAYTSEHELTDFPQARLRGVYRFTPGRAEGVILSFYYSEIWDYKVQDGPLTGRRWKLKSPFSYSHTQGMGFDVVGTEEIAKGPMRYCGIEPFLEDRGGDYSIELLTACCFYPRQIEMLMKAGLVDAVWDLAARAVKNAAVLDWTKTGPEAIKVERPTFKQFMRQGDGKNMEPLRVYKALKGKVDIETCAKWVSDGFDRNKLSKKARIWNVPLERLGRYLAEQAGENGNIALSTSIWEDYLQMAQVVGEELHHDNILMPRPLGEAHDIEVEKVLKITGGKMRNKYEEKRLLELRELEKGYEGRRKKLEKKYAYAADGYLIKIPQNGMEIKLEGAKLKHCVGGYADRHLKGQTTILFMRKEKTPNSPWLTIEMNGNRLVQIHGYKNEGVYSRKRIAPDPRETYREWLDRWLQWLKAGSPRNKDGTPKDINIPVVITAA